MTTLEQKLQEECNSQMYYLTPKQVIKIVKEWLQQKRGNEYLNKKGKWEIFLNKRELLKELK